INGLMYLLTQPKGHRPTLVDDRNFYRKAGVAKWGFDHGVGHSLLPLYDAKAVWSKYSNAAFSKAFHLALALSQWCEQSTIFLGTTRAPSLRNAGVAWALAGIPETGRAE